MSYRITDNLQLLDSSVTASNIMSYNTNGFVDPATSFRDILADMLDSIDETTAQMQEVRSEMQSIKNDQQITEIIRRLMPDGSVMITEYNDGKIVSRYRKKPHMIAVPDENAPIKTAKDGTWLMAQQPMVLKPSKSIASELFYWV